MQVPVGGRAAAAGQRDPSFAGEPASIAGDPGPLYHFRARLPQDVTVVVPQGARPDLVVGRHRPQHRSVGRSLATWPPGPSQHGPGQPPCRPAAKARMNAGCRRSSAYIVIMNVTATTP